jgi:hypothetical protein
MIRGDSSEYELLKKWCETTPVFSPRERFYSCEIGVREGLGSKIIMDSFRERIQGTPYIHFGVDPYGNLEYQHYDNTGAYTCDYTDAMYEQMMKDFESYPMFYFTKMTDIEFMNQYTNIDYFNFVHFDGPHMTKDVITESVWFANKSVKGTRFIFDDYPKYDMPFISKILEKYGFKTIEAGKNKICLERNES